MRNVIFLYAFVATIIASSCGETEGKNPLIIRVQNLEAELTKMSEKQAPLNEVDSTRRELISALHDLYNAKLSDSLSADCLDKIHLSYSAMHNYVQAAHYADTLINSYPDYTNRALVLESQANNYDMFILPRNVEKVKHYLNLLLQENPDLPKEKRADIEYRLKYIDLTIEELMQKEMTELN